MNNYLFYYRPVINFINQNTKDYDFLGLEFYSYLNIRFRVYSPSKTKIPAIALTVIIFGLGFEFYTHDRL